LKTPHHLEDKTHVRKKLFNIDLITLF